MSQTTLEKLQQDWPKRHGLTPEEVAQVLGRDNTSRGVLQKIRAKMKDGTYPNAIKVDGRWLLPLEEMAAILSPSPIIRPIPMPSVAGSRRRASSLGPKIRFEICQFWIEVHHQCGFKSDALELEQEKASIQKELDWLEELERQEQLKQEQEQFLKETLTPHVPELKKERF